MDPVRCILFVILLFAGGYFAGTEIALASVNKIRITSEADDGNKKSQQVAYILDNFDKALSTLLIGNNIAHIGCSTIATVMTYDFIQNYNWPASAQVITTLCTTVIVFLAAEMLPKCFAKSCNESFAKAVAPSLIFLMRVLTPISFVFTFLGNFLSRPFAKRVEVQPTVTEEELHDIIDTVVQEGELDENTGELVQSALEFSESKVREVFTPWKNVVTVSTAMKPEEIITIINNNTHSRLPVVDEKGEAVGVLQIRNYLRSYLRDPNVDLKTLMRKPHFVQQGKPVDELLPLMSSQRSHLSFVNDPNGKVIGIITIEDILEELVGEIYDEEDAKGGVAHA